MTAKSNETICTVCGAAVAEEEWHPAAVEQTDDGSTLIRSFCSEKCREVWTESPEESDMTPDPSDTKSKPDKSAD